MEYFKDWIRRCLLTAPNETMNSIQVSLRTFERYSWCMWIWWGIELDILFAFYFLAPCNVIEQWGQKKNIYIFLPQNWHSNHSPNDGSQIEWYSEPWWKGYTKILRFLKNSNLGFQLQGLMEQSNSSLKPPVDPKLSSSVNHFASLQRIVFVFCIVLWNYNPQLVVIPLSKF